MVDGATPRRRQPRESVGCVLQEKSLTHNDEALQEFMRRVLAAVRQCSPWLHRDGESHYRKQPQQHFRSSSISNTAVCCARAEPAWLQLRRG